MSLKKHVFFSGAMLIFGCAGGGFLATLFEISAQVELGIMFSIFGEKNPSKSLEFLSWKRSLTLLGVLFVFFWMAIINSNNPVPGYVFEAASVSML